MKTLSKLAAAAVVAVAVAGPAAAAPTTTKANDPFVSTALAGVSPMAIVGILTLITIAAANSTD